MLISDAKKHIGQIVEIDYLDRTGATHTEIVEVFDVNFIALYGPCLITDIGDIRLDRVSRAVPSTQAKVA